MKKIFISGLICSALALKPNAVAEAPTNTIVLTADYLSQLAEELRTNHPALRAANARAESAKVNIDSIRTWEDPMARLGGMAAREEMRADEGDLLYGVEQKLPLFGKSKLARKVASAEAAAESANAEYQFQQLRVELARAAFRTALAAEVINIGQEDLNWLDLTLQTMESRYSSGQASLTELLQLQNEQSKRATALETDRNQLNHEQVTLNRFLNREAQTPWPQLKLPPPAKPIPFNQRLVDFALKFEPRLLMRQQQLRQSEATVELTKRQRLPDVNVGLEARNYTGDGSFRQGMLVFSMNLPWGNAERYRNDIKREQFKLKATAFDLEDYRASLREEVHQLTVKIDAARREALLYRDQILPRNESALESARASWESNRGSIRELLDARRMLLEARLMYARAVAEQYEMMSELVLCCGAGDFNALTMIGAESEQTSGAK